MAFGTISEIVPSLEETWRNKLFLTIDIDWAHDEVLREMIELVAQAEVFATWFVTHETPCLEVLRRNPRFELGIHPNFNYLLEGDFRNGRNATEVVGRLMDFLPGSKSVRSHSITQSSVLSDVFARAGLTHDVNYFVPEVANSDLLPWVLWNGMYRIPYCWEDYVHIRYEKTVAQKEPFELARSGHGIKVFDFHPIHVFLNTESLDRYERTRPLHHHPAELVKHRYEGYGTRNRFMEVLNLASLGKS